MHRQPGPYNNIHSNSENNSHRLPMRQSKDLKDADEEQELDQGEAKHSTDLYCDDYTDASTVY